MRYIEIITESRSAPLYHGTSAEAASMIAQSGVLKAGRVYAANGRDILGISATRNKRLNYSHGEGMGGAEVVFELNQQAIASRYRIVPYNDMGVPRASFDTESEEVILTPELPLNSKTVSFIVLLAKAPGVVEWAQQQEIPYQIEYPEFDDEDDWD